jgi:two-component sensor histidine kinase
MPLLMLTRRLSPMSIERDAVSKKLEPLRDAVLRQLAEGEPAKDVLRSICLALEQLLPGSVVGVTMLDRSSQIFEDALFPSLSEAYAKALKGIAVADKPGTCALAVFKGQTVICHDVVSDSRFSEGWKTLGLKHGLRALISIPAIGPRSLTLGTLVVTFKPGSPLSPAGLDLAHEAADLSGLVLHYRRNQLKNELLLGELQHRLRNLFGAVGAIVYATLRSHPDADDFRRVFDGRLKALAKAHSLAVSPGQAELRQLIKDTLAPYSLDHEIRIEGPKLMLTQESAVALSLATHELATNAAKYGALSRPGGSVHVQWIIDGGDTGRRFALGWTETGGPVVEPPSRQGYGQQTLKRGVASAFDGSVELQYSPTGLKCRITAPLSPRLGQSVN